MKKILVVFVSVVFAFSAWGQALPSLLIGADPAAAGVGGAALARPADAFAIDHNAAAMSLSPQKFSAALSYGMWAPGTANNTLLGMGVWYRLGDKVALGLSGKMLKDKNFEQASSDMIASLGASYAIMKGLSVGLTARFVSSTLTPEYKGTAVGADITALYQRGALSAALGVCNLGSSVSYGGASYAQPALVRAGAAYTVVGITASAQVDYLFSGALMADVGAEYCIADIISLRAGYHYGASGKTLASHASLGLGVRYAGVSLNVAWLTASATLGNSLLFGLGYTF